MDNVWPMELATIMGDISNVKSTCFVMFFFIFYFFAIQLQILLNSPGEFIKVKEILV